MPGDECETYVGRAETATGDWYRPRRLGYPLTQRGEEREVPIHSHAVRTTA
jgi:hypothetical protein